MKKKIWIHLLVVLLMIGVFWLLQRIFMPKYASEILEGGMISEYYDEEPKHNVLFIGDCEVYENISPVTLYEKYGLTSYIRGSAQQLIWQSYYLLEEALQYEKPDVVVFNVLSMKYDTPQSEAYNRMSIDGMKLSKSKLDNIKASMTEEETMISYLFPLLRYHSRWNELKAEDIKYAFAKKRQVTVAGYLMHVEEKAVTTIPDPNLLADYQFGESSYKYLDMITDLCKENDIELVLIKAPSLSPYWYDEWDAQMVDYAVEHDLQYINFLEYQDEIGIDWNTDTYDRGLHLNIKGAEKLADYFGKILVDTYDFTDYSEDEAVVKDWEEKVRFYEEMKADQYREMEEYGYLKSYGGHPPAEQ